MKNEDLVALIQTGEDVQGNQLRLYWANEPFIISTARAFTRQPELLEDLQQEGFLALCEAADRWDPKAGNTFLTYAGTVIKRRMSRYLCTCCGNLHLPEWGRRRAGRYSRFISDFYRDHGREPTDSETVRALNLTPAALDDVKMDVTRIYALSLDAPIDDDSDDTLEGITPADYHGIEDAERAVDADLLAVNLWSIVDSLPPAQAAEIREHYQGTGRTIKDTAATMGITDAAARSLERRAFRALRNSPTCRQLMTFISDSTAYSRGLQRGDSTARAALKALEDESRLQGLLKSWQAYSAGLTAPK